MFKVLTFLSANLLSYTIATNEEGLAFLEKKDKEEGVVKLESGLRYKVLEPGTGLHAPKVGTSCEVTYKGTLIDGTEFDSGTTSFAPNQVIKGWTEAMQLMVEGAKWELTIPSELAYGENGSPPKIPGGAVLVFEMQIHKIKGPKKRLVKCDLSTKEGCQDAELEALKKHVGKSKNEIQAALKKLKKDSKQTLKPGQHEKIKADKESLKTVFKHLKANNLETFEL